VFYWLQLWRSPHVGVPTRAAFPLCPRSCFSLSPYSMPTYDRVVQYRQPCPTAGAARQPVQPDSGAVAAADRVAQQRQQGERRQPQAPAEAAARRRDGAQRMASRWDAPGWAGAAAERAGGLSVWGERSGQSTGARAEASAQGAALGRGRGETASSVCEAASRARRAGGCPGFADGGGASSALIRSDRSAAQAEPARPGTGARAVAAACPDCDPPRAQSAGDWQRGTAAGDPGCEGLARGPAHEATIPRGARRSALDAAGLRRHLGSGTRRRSGDGDLELAEGGERVTGDDDRWPMWPSGTLCSD
jgi:hypothetical protein